MFKEVSVVQVRDHAACRIMRRECSGVMFVADQERS